MNARITVRSAPLALWTGVLQKPVSFQARADAIQLEFVRCGALTLEGARALSAELRGARCVSLSFWGAALAEGVVEEIAGGVSEAKKLHVPRPRDPSDCQAASTCLKSVKDF